MADSTTRVTVDDLDMAIMWLETNEGDAEEREPIQRVAEWLKAERNRREEAAIVRRVVKETGATPSRARAALIKARQ